MECSEAPPASPPNSPATPLLRGARSPSDSSFPRLQPPRRGPLPALRPTARSTPLPLLCALPHSPNFFFPPSLNFSHSSARLLHSHRPTSGPHSRWRSASCPPGANPWRESPVPGLVPKRPACDGSAPGAARREGAGLWMRDGRGQGEGKREEEEVAAGLKAAVSWQLGQALVSALQLRSGHDRSRDGSTRASARPRRIFPVPGSSPFTSPPPRLSLSRRSGAEPRDQPAAPAVALAESGQPRGAQPGGASKGRLGSGNGRAPSGLWSRGGGRSDEAPLTGLRGPPRAPGLRRGRSGAPAARAGSPPWCSGVRDVEDAEEEEALAQQGAGVRRVLGRAPGRLRRGDPRWRGAWRVPLPGAAPRGARRGHLLRRLGQGAQPRRCAAGGKRDACQRAHQPGHSGCHPPLPRAHPSQDCETRCPEGFLGEYCQHRDPCEKNRCQNGGTCVAQAMLGKATCRCASGFTGEDCQYSTSHPCFVSRPCLNGGTCHMLSRDTYECTCQVGFTGKECQWTDACLSHPCANGSTCTTVANQFSCKCLTGFTGQKCETDVNECDIPGHCQHGGTCLNLPGSYQCQCPQGFTGQYCDSLYVPCAPSPCVNGGTCRQTGDFTFECNCLPVPGPTSSATNVSMVVSAGPLSSE
nr:protein crumbs homolog 2-like [Pan troglodytes]